MNRVQKSQNFERLGNISMIKIPWQRSNLAKENLYVISPPPPPSNPSVWPCRKVGGTMLKLTHEMRTNSRKKESIIHLANLEPQLQLRRRCGVPPCVT